MNDDRRKELRRAKALVDEAQAIVASCAEEEREYRDNMPENMQGGDKGSAAEEKASELEDVASELEDLAGKLEEAAS